MFRLTVVSVNGGHYPEETARFNTLEEVKAVVPGEMKGLSSYYQVMVTKENDTVVMRGWRAGPSGTGDVWAWSENVEI